MISNFKRGGGRVLSHFDAAREEQRCSLSMSIRKNGSQMIKVLSNSCEALQKKAGGNSRKRLEECKASVQTEQRIFAAELNGFLASCS